MNSKNLPRPPGKKCFRAVFAVEEKNQSGHMKAIKQSVLDGTSKWSAKIAITGLHLFQTKRQKNRLILFVVFTRYLHL